MDWTTKCDGETGVHVAIDVPRCLGCRAQTLPEGL